MDLSWIDIGIIVIFFVSIVISIFRGFVKEAISLISWILAIWLAITFSGQVASFLPASIDEATFNLGTNELEVSKLRVGIAFILIVVASLIIGALVNYILGKITHTSVLRGIDRMLGAFFGLARGAIVVVLFVLVAALTSFPHTDNWQSSQLLPPFELTARNVVEFLPPEYSKYFSFDEA